jgi:hypothetical protein
MVVDGLPRVDDVDVTTLYHGDLLSPPHLNDLGAVRVVGRFELPHGGRREQPGHHPTVTVTVSVAA